MTGRVVHLLTGGAVSLALFLAVAAVSQWPSWQSVPDEAAVIRLSLRHGGVRACRPASEEELARLPPNMRLREICDRRRAPVHVRLVLDGQALIDRAVPPSGLWGTGPSRLYARFAVPAGPHQIALWLAENPEGDGARWELARQVTLTPGENLAIDFDTEAGGFVFHEGRREDG
ncbi:hypothetical protein SAMN05216257_103426 [Meinhardsimonia xiamenensis]|jgi:hypothetical protein|uniref:Uncharacterized protein n=1 Tax=Meinhardsimonia xiamenensis TaxID=990712 RepID=A0A1G9DBT8_9RHOB|nr:hypothetical protein [Meinhardsimonia xiamenensis]PRX38055.1 hypothetical protein LV81_00328 [Meinhardsimonia xiamenensis]SDK61283.1 hypothetical protein SAMN05216257_103426 [Meinhardsimonia xiamenensis]